MLSSRSVFSASAVSSSSVSFLPLFSSRSLATATAPPTPPKAPAAAAPAAAAASSAKASSMTVADLLAAPPALTVEEDFSKGDPFAPSAKSIPNKVMAERLTKFFAQKKAESTQKIYPSAAEKAQIEATYAIQDRDKPKWWKRRAPEWYYPVDNRPEHWGLPINADDPLNEKNYNAVMSKRPSAKQYYEFLATTFPTKGKSDAEIEALNHSAELGAAVIKFMGYTDMYDPKEVLANLAKTAKKV